MLRPFLHNRIISRTLLMSALVFTAGCSKSSDSMPAQEPAANKRGGLDGGGGNAQTSNAIDVETEILESKVNAYLSLTHIALYRNTISDTTVSNVIRKIESHGTSVSKDEIDAFIEKTIEKMSTGRSLRALQPTDANFSADLGLAAMLSQVGHLGKGARFERSQFLAMAHREVSLEFRLGLIDVLRQAKLTPSDALCNSNVGVHTEASVDRNSVGANVCFSKLGLQRIPRESLQRQLTSLMVHETAHMLGFNENDAYALQEFVIRNFNIVPGLDSNGAHAWIRLASTFSFGVDGLTKDIVRLVDSLKQHNTSRIAICYYVGRASSLSDTLNLNWFEIESSLNEHGQSGEFIQLVDSLRKRAEQFNKSIRQFEQNSVQCFNEAAFDRNSMQGAATSLLNASLLFKLELRKLTDPRQ